MGNSVRRMAPSIPNPIRRNKKPRLLLLREEKDRFDAMRKIQTQTHKFKSWYALIFSVGAFGILWCVGAVVFWQTEKDAQDMTYFRALYFCYISLLTIGYGDLSPKTNAGRCFFVVWSLIAVPTMTILVSDMGDTVIHKFKIWSSELADFTVLPKEGIWRSFLDKHPWLLIWIQTLVDKRAAKKRLKAGFKTTDPNATISPNEVDDTEAAEVNEIETQFLNTVKPTSNLQTIMHAAPLDLNPGTLRTHLAVSIRLVATDMRLHTLKKYCYEEWVEFTRLLRYSSNHTCADDVAAQEEEEGLVDWDYLGEDSPLISGGGESEWLLQRLTEALVRVERRVEHRVEMRVGREKEKDISRTGEGNDDEQIERTVDIEGEISEATRRGTEMEGDCLRKRDEEVESEELRRRRIEH
jgi:potassium channel subfamily K